MRAALRSLRSLILGETWTIPLGIATVLATALALRAILPEAVWGRAGGFLIALGVAATLAVSWRGQAS